MIRYVSHNNDFVQGLWALHGQVLNVHLHRHGYCVGIFEVKMADDGVNIGLLEWMDGACVLIVYDFDAKEPIQFA